VYNLTPPDPWLKGAWYPGGFNPCTYQVKKPVSRFAFQVNNLRRYREAMEAGVRAFVSYIRGGALQVESS
jgi:hypothetical protein